MIDVLDVSHGPELIEKILRKQGAEGNCQKNAAFDDLNLIYIMFGKMLLSEFVSWEESWTRIRKHLCVHFTLLRLALCMTLFCLPYLGVILLRHLSRSIYFEPVTIPAR